VHSTQKSLSELGDKVSGADKSTVEAAIADLKAVIDGSDAETIKTKTSALAQAAMKLGEAMYKAQGAPDEGGEAGPQPGGERASSADEDVLDADFTEVKDDDKKSA